MSYDLTYTLQFPFSLKFSYNSFSHQPKTFGYVAYIDVSPELGIDSDLAPLDDIKIVAESTIALFNNCTFLNLEDPYLRYYVDPKNGDTKDNFIKKLKEDVAAAGGVFLGNEVPPNTFDRSRALVVNAKCCHETVALYLLKELVATFAMNRHTEGAAVSLRLNVPSEGIDISLKTAEPSQLSLKI